MPLPTNSRLAQSTAIELDAKGELPEQIMLLPVGDFETGKYGQLAITDEHLAKAVANFNRGVPNGVPINLDHMYGEAAGWITGLIHQMGVGLFATVNWTSLGETKLSDKLYRFFSAEFDYDFKDPANSTKYGFTLTGGALTNYPLMTELPALVANNKTNTQTIYLLSQEGASMNLDEIRAKDAAALSDDEKSYLTEHAAELSDDERTKFGFSQAEPAEPQEPAEPAEPTTPAEPVAASAKQGTVTMSAVELDALKKAANEGQQAMVELNRQKMSRDIVEPMVFSAINADGRFLSKSKDKLTQFVFSLKDEAQRTAFVELMAELPKTLEGLTKEIGDGGKVEANSASEKLNELAQAKVLAAAKDGKSLDFSQALDEVTGDNPELVKAEYGIEGGN